MRVSTGSLLETGFPRKDGLQTKVTQVLADAAEPLI
jgi:hypothetical protein